MTKTLIMLAAAVCAGVLLAQAQPAAEKKPAAPAKQAVKPAEEPEESVVMIDSRTEPEDPRQSAAPAEERQAPAGIPSSYGQCRGVMSEAGRTVLVFESPEDGSLAFVQISIGKSGVGWKLLDRVYRSAD